MLAIRAYLLVDYQVNAEATPDSIPPAHGTRPSSCETGGSRAEVAAAMVRAAVVQNNLNWVGRVRR
jgi:hypothetical protein